MFLLYLPVYVFLGVQAAHITIRTLTAILNEKHNSASMTDIAQVYL
jgi:hypothetical protein